MSQQRYHIHVCLVKNEQPTLENALQIAMADSYFLTWDLYGAPSNFMDYTRKQIDRCDYVLFVLGDSYGNLSPSGVSFLHLSYVYATTKRKNLFALIKQADTVVPQNETRIRQRADFAGMVEKDQAEYTTYYGNDMTGAVTTCLINLSQLIEAVPKAGWVKSSKVHLEQNERLFTPNKGLTPSQLTTSNPLLKDPLLKDSLLADEGIKERLVTPRTQSGQSEPAGLSGLRTPATRNTSPASISSAKMSSAKTLTPSDSIHINRDMSADLSLEDSITLHYTAHAYRDGNLADLSLQQDLMWLDIVVSLRKLKEPFTSDMMQRNLNNLLNKFALPSAKNIQPNTHAVARTQINATDFDHIKKQLIAQHWLTPAISTTGAPRDMWQISDELK